MSCQKELKSMCKTILETIDARTLHYLAVWTDPMIERALTDSQTEHDDSANSLFNTIIISDRGALNPYVADVEHAYDTIKALAKDDPEDERNLHYYSSEKTGKRTFNPW